VHTVQFLYFPSISSFITVCTCIFYLCQTYEVHTVKYARKIKKILSKPLSNGPANTCECFYFFLKTVCSFSFFFFFYHFFAQIILTLHSVLTYPKYLYFLLSRHIYNHYSNLQTILPPTSASVACKEFICVLIKTMIYFKTQHCIFEQ
jgi:hypothetical protein